jgi:hypothetical protein
LTGCQHPQPSGFRYRTVPIHRFLASLSPNNLPQYASANFNSGKLHKILALYSW